MCLTLSDTKPQKPYDRLPSEAKRDKPWQAFCLYRDMGESRILLKANHCQQNAQRQNTGLPEPQRLQAKFLECEADIALYGGAAGSGKSYGMLLDFAKPDFLANPGYGAVIFRRTYPQIRNEGSLWDESSKLYPLVGGIPKESLLKWQFPTGSSIRFAHLQHEKKFYVGATSVAEK